MEDLSLQQICAARSVDVHIDDYGFCGEGYVRLADGWMSVPGALPGEWVRVCPESEVGYGRRVFARLVEVLTPSERRRDPLCKRDDVCRGCQLRHANIAEEMRFHVRTVQEVVEKFGGVALDAQPTPEIITPQPISRGDAFRIRSVLTYRRILPARATALFIDDQDEVTGAEVDTPVRFELGLISPAHPQLVPMFDCPALTTPVRRLVSTVRRVLDESAELPWDAAMLEQADSETHCPPAISAIHVASPVIGRGWVEVRLCDTDKPDLLEHAIAEGALKRFFEKLGEELPDEVGLAVSVGRRRVSLKGPNRLVIPLAGLRTEVGYDDWFPATLAPSEALYSSVIDWLELNEDDLFLDIGSGIGTISLLAASIAQQVVGLDINRQSIATAEINAVANGRTNAEFVVGGWEKALRQLTLNGQHFTAATINPMREPIGRRALSYLNALKIQRLVYLGPSPASAAKDIAELGKMGWHITKLAAANIHPATYHTMLVAKLERDDNFT